MEKCSCKKHSFKNCSNCLRSFKVCQAQESWRFLYSRVGTIWFNKSFRLSKIIRIDGMNSHRNNWLQPDLSGTRVGEMDLLLNSKSFSPLRSLANLWAAGTSGTNDVSSGSRSELLCLWPLHAAFSVCPSTLFCFSGNWERCLFHLNSRERTWLVQQLPSALEWGAHAKPVGWPGELCGSKPRGLVGKAVHGRYLKHELSTIVGSLLTFCKQ